MEKERDCLGSSFKTTTQCFLCLNFLLIQDSPIPICEDTLLRDHSTTAWELNFICALGDGKVKSGVFF